MKDYSRNNQNELSSSSTLEAKKHFILERILDFGFVSHMELVSLQPTSPTEAARDDLRDALSELEESGVIRRTYKTTISEDVIVGYCLNTESR